MKLNNFFKLKPFFFRKISCIFIFLSLTVFVFADRYSHLELFAQALNLIKINYFKPVKLETLVYGAIKGLLREIDPHSHFLTPEDLEKLKEETSGQFYGLGIEVEKKIDFLIVVSVLKDSPAEKAGFQQGDKIFQIDNKVVRNFTVNEFRYFLKKQRKKVYKIKVLRAHHDQPLFFRVRPVRLDIQSVEFEEIEDSLFYIRIHYFSQKTLFEMNHFLKDKTIKGLILDLRGNPGGVFEQSVQVADLFLNEGLIVRYKIKTEKQARKFSAHYSNTLPDFPLIVLINEYTASASEIVAGALKDHKRAILIGRTSFGKGSIQNVFPLADRHALKLTVGEYQTPSGRFIHNNGVEPHIKLKKMKKNVLQKSEARKAILKDSEIYRAFKVLKNKKYNRK